MLRLLLGGALLLPVALLVVAAAGRLLGSMGDTAAARVLERLALAGGLAWVILLVLLLLALAWQATDREPPGDE
jgi:hypothetical protein